MIPQSNRLGQTKSAPGAAGGLLVVEPDHLIRWSIATFFSDRFEVCATEKAEEAEALLEKGHTRALVVSDNLPPAEVLRLEDSARRHNPTIRIVRIVSERVGREDEESDCTYLKKPFDLKRLAELLGVPGAEDSNSRPRPAPGPDS